jgi:hypothetical protein
MILSLILMTVLLMSGCQKIMVFIGMNVGPGIKIITIIPDELTNGETGTIIIKATDENGDSLTISWIVNDEPQADFDNLTEFTLEESPSAQTVYKIKVVVSDGKETASKTFFVTVLAPGQETFGVTLYGNTTAAYDEAQTLTAIITGATPGGTVIYQWFVNNSQQTVSDPTDSTFSFSQTPAAETQYTVRVVVIEGDRTDQDEINITVRAQGVANPTVTIGSYYSESPTRISVNSGWYGQEFYAYPSMDFSYNTATIEWYVDDVVFQSAMTSSQYGDYFYLDSYELPETTEETTYIIKVIVREGTMEAVDTLEFVVEAPPVMDPVLTPGGSSYSPVYISTGTEITMETTTDGASIYYTTDVSDPTTSGTRLLYEGPFVIPLDTTEIKAYAVKTGMDDSSVVTKYYEWRVAAPVFAADREPDIEPNVWFSGPLIITMTSADLDAVIHFKDYSTTYVYNTDPVYDTPQEITGSSWFSAKAYKEGWTTSSLTREQFKITGILQPVEFSPVPGPHPGSIDVTLSCPDVYEDYIYYTLDGTDPVPGNTNTFEYSSAIPIDQTTTIRAFAREEDWGDSPVSSGLFEIAPVVDLTIPEFLPLSAEYTSVEFTEDVLDRWYSIRIPESGIYFLNFADFEYGEEIDTANGTVYLYESDGSTIAGGMDGNDYYVNLYSTAESMHLAQGDYLLKVHSWGMTGFCRVRVY